MSAVRGRGPATGTLFAQIFALTVLSLLLAQAVNVWVIFQLPRPTPEFYTAMEIANALKRRPAADMPTERALIVRRIDQLEIGGGLEAARGFRRVRGEIAHAIPTDPSNVVIAISDSRYDRAVFLNARDQLERRGRREAPFLFSPFIVAVRQADGGWLTAQPPGGPFLSPWQLRVILWFVITSLAMAPMAWLFARRLSSSVTLFAEAAERLGRNPNSAPMPVEGPREILPAIAAFNEMQEKLRRYVADRTAMAAAVAHDLRTPLTRMRFRIEAAPADLRAKMAADIDEMEAMVAATMAYVRDASGVVEHTRLELSSLLESVVDDLAETGAQASIEHAERVVISGDPTALRRLLGNLIENACKFGGKARARLESQSDWAVATVEDDGPGIPEADLEKVFEPFYRGEPSRNRETGGSGLGLAAVRAIARLHGGDVTLSNLPGGGLCATVKLPLP
jgi:two-component system, OmpR family, sensor kinase